MSAVRPEFMKRANEALVRSALENLGRASKGALAADTGLSLTTVGQVLAQMSENGEIRLSGYADSSGGRKAGVYELDPEACAVYAVAVERDRLDWAVANALGTVTADGTRLVREDPMAEAAALIEGLRRDALIERPPRAAVAVGVPGAVLDGRIITGFLRDEWEDRDAASYFISRLGLPVVVENDMNATALGFSRRTAKEGRELESLAYIVTNGRCTGSGYVCGGQVVRGAARFAGELGFLPQASGRTFDEELAETENAAGYARLYAAALETVNCVVNPALIVAGGTAFRFELSDAVGAEFAARIDPSIRPALVFEKDTRPDYLYGLCGLAIDEVFPAYRIIEKRSSL